MASDIEGRILANALEYYSQTALQQMLSSLQLGYPLGRAQKNLAKAALEEFLGRPEHLDAIEAAMTPQHWLALAVDRLKGQPCTIHALTARLRAMGIAGAEGLKILEDLLALGCLIYAPGQDSRSLSLGQLSYGREYGLKRRVIAFPQVISHAERRARDLLPGVEPADPPESVQRGTFLEAQREVFLALQAIASSQFRLTVRGLPFKKDLAKLATQVNGGVTGPTRNPSGRGTKGAVADAATRERPEASEASPRLWFLLSLLEPAGLIEDDGGKWQTTTAAKSFLQAPAREQVLCLCSAWPDSVFSEFRRIETLVSWSSHAYIGEPWLTIEPYEYEVSDVPGLRRLRTGRLAIDRVLRRIGEKGGWIDIAEFAGAVWRDDPEFLVPLVRIGFSRYWAGLERPYDDIRRTGVSYPAAQLVVGTDWPEVEGAFVARVVTEPLHWLGLVDLGRDAAGKVVSFQLTPLGRQVFCGEDASIEPSRGDASPLVVQPNFDLVVIEARGNFDLIARIEEFAERQTLDRAAVYRLSRGSVVGGLDKGLNGAEMLRLLEDSSGRPLPQNVRYSIEEWVRLYERVHLRQSATLLEADSREEMDRWLADPSLARLIGKRLSPRAALVPLSSRDELADLLQQRQTQLETVDYTRPARRVLRVEEAGDVYVPAKHDEPYLRYQLGSFAEEVEARGANGERGERRYRITPQSMKRGVASGLSPDSIARYLVAMARETVPPDALLRVRGWGGFYGPLRQEAAIAVEMPGGLDWEAIKAVPSIAELILRHMSARLILVSADKFEALRAALAERGIELEHGLPAQERGEEQRR